jgi:hypothetical protein
LLNGYSDVIILIMSNFASDPESFLKERASTPGVDSLAFRRLLTTVAGVVSRNVSISYSNTEHDGARWYDRRSYEDFEVQRNGFTRTSDGRAVDTRVFPVGLPEYVSTGVVAMAGIAPTDKTRIDDLYVLSTDGTSFWVTELDKGYSINPDGLETLVEELEKV